MKKRLLSLLRANSLQENPAPKTGWLRFPLHLGVSIATFIFTLPFIATGYAQQPGSTITIADFKALAGKWEGRLTYLDYTSNRPDSIPANTVFEIKNDTVLSQSIYYTEEPDKSGEMLYTIRKNGTWLNDMKLVHRSVENGRLHLIFEFREPDGNDNRMATMQQQIQIVADELIITKLVKYDGENNFFQRNQYRFKRKP